MTTAIATIIALYLIGCAIFSAIHREPLTAMAWPALVCAYVLLRIVEGWRQWRRRRVRPAPRVLSPPDHPMCRCIVRPSWPDGFVGDQHNGPAALHADTDALDRSARPGTRIDWDRVLELAKDDPELRRRAILQRDRSAGSVVDVEAIGGPPVPVSLDARAAAMMYQAESTFGPFNDNTRRLLLPYCRYMVETCDQLLADAGLIDPNLEHVDLDALMAGSMNGLTYEELRARMRGRDEAAAVEAYYP